MFNLFKKKDSWSNVKEPIHITISHKPIRLYYILNPKIIGGVKWYPVSFDRYREVTKTENGQTSTYREWIDTENLEYFKTRKECETYIEECKAKDAEKS